MSAARDDELVTNVRRLVLEVELASERSRAATYQQCLKAIAGALITGLSDPAGTLAHIATVVEIFETFEKATETA